MQLRISPLSHSGLDLRENFTEPAESFRRNAGKDDILEMLITMKKEMEEREDKWEKHQQIREEFLEVEFSRKKTIIGAEYETERRMMERRNEKEGERIWRKDEG